MEEVETNSKIVGCIRNQKGNALGGVKVVCDGNDTLTLFDGTYRFESLNPGIYTITVSIKGFQSQNKLITIQEDEIMTLDFYLTKALGTAKICGHVYDAETKKPIISGGTIILIQPVSNRYTHINKNGYYEFTDLAKDIYDICVSISGYVDIKDKINVEEGETKLRDFFCNPIQIIEPPWG